MENQTPQPPPQARIMELTFGTLVAQSISAAAELGVADALADGPRPVDEIAEEVGADPQALYRLLRALTVFEVFEELEGRRFASTPMGEALRDGVPGSMRHWAIMVGRPFHRYAWTNLVNAVRTGDSAFELLYGENLVEYLREHPGDARVLDRAMTQASGGAAVAVTAGEYDFGTARTVVDVGGGQGALLAAILEAHPRVRGVLFDLPDVVENQTLDAAGFGDRCDYVGGSFFESAPAGGDVYLLSNIIHDWDDDSSVRILRNCREAMNPGGRVLLGEAVLPDGPEPSQAKLIDLEMLVLAVRGARQRTESEFRGLFDRAGLRLTRIISSDRSPFSLVEAVTADQRP
jgi:SAM-dependent methyltransferase